jgi:SAM-dependent methyltransferase
MVYQHPLAYLLGLEGVALLRAYAGDYDRDFCQERIAEIRRLLDAAELGGDGVTAASVGTVEGYRVWSATYDDPGNGLYPLEEPFVHEVLAPLPTGIALDAACGTGRHTQYLAGLGHQVIGVDSSPDMLERGRSRVPQAHFRQGDLHQLPVPDDHCDIVVCALALTHLDDLTPVFAEFARVLRPGGHLVVTDVHHELVALGSVPRIRSADGRPGLMLAPRHRAGDYLSAALPVGLQVRRCEEPRQSGGDHTAPMAESIDAGPWDQWPWSMLHIIPAAVSAAWNGTPALIMWHFQLAGR